MSAQACPGEACTADSHTEHAHGLVAPEPLSWPRPIRVEGGCLLMQFLWFPPEAMPSGLLCQTAPRFSPVMVLRLTGAGGPGPGRPPLIIPGITMSLRQCPVPRRGQDCGCAAFPASPCHEVPKHPLEASVSGPGSPSAKPRGLRVVHSGGNEGI